MKGCLVALCVALSGLTLSGQGAGYKPGNAISVTPTVPPTCIVGEVAIVTTTTTDDPMGTYFCTQPNVWQRMNYALLKNFTGLQNNVFSDVLTITIPNIGLSALVQVDVLGALGAGGAVGAYEASTGRTVYIAVTRVVGLNADTTLTIAVNAADAKVLGGAGITLGTQIGPLSGGPTATQVVTLQARIVRGGGTSNNHALSLRALVLKQFGPGVSIT